MNKIDKIIEIEKIFKKLFNKETKEFLELGLEYNFLEDILN